MFTGTLRVKICEACGLRPTDFQTRHAFGKLGNDQSIDPYVSIDVDEKYIGNYKQMHIPHLFSYYFLGTV
jgi:novel protein kinase C epsilon type